MKNLASLWTVYGLVDPAQSLTICGTQLYLGGPGLQNPTGYFERTYTNFAAHDIIYLAMDVAAGGTWQATDMFSIQIDDLKSWNFPIYTAISSRAIYTCTPSGRSSMIQRVLGKVLHQDSSATLKVSWSFQAGSSPFPFLGIKEIFMSFGLKTSADTEDIKIALTDTTLTYSTQCNEVQYWKTPENVCANCNSPCESCFGSASSQCYSYNQHVGYTTNGPFVCASNCRLCTGVAANQCVECFPSH